MFYASTSVDNLGEYESINNITIDIIKVLLRTRDNITSVRSHNDMGSSRDSYPCSRFAGKGLVFHLYP